jgi:hypothetical protein
MTKIQKAIPASLKSLKLMDLANAGVAIRVINPIVNPVNLCFFSLNKLLSPFPNGSIYQLISCANVKLRINPFDSPV